MKRSMIMRGLLGLLSLLLCGFAGAATTNWALSSNGATATASTQYNTTTYSAAAAINGDRTTDGYNDATGGSYPDWLQGTFSGSKTIGEISVFTLQDNFSNPSPPTETMTFTSWGITDFSVEYWDGSAWQTVPGGSVTGNNKVWRKFTFSPIATTAIRVYVTASLGSYSRITELEAYEAAVAPAAPSGLSATVVSTSQINLSWTDNSGNETGFDVERKTGSGGTYALVTTTAAGATSFSDTGLTSSTTYYYRVRAVNAAGASSYSNEANGTTLAPPAAPSNLTATTVSSSAINLSWTDNSGTETGFQVERRAGAQATYTVVATLAANATSYSDTGLSELTKYYYRVVATSSTMNSAYSNVANAVTTGATPFSNVYYIQTDQLNAPRAITNASNTMVWRWDSEPFGGSAAEEDADSNSVLFTYNLRFPGQYLDKETNLHYNYFRDYDPSIGRYIQSDPIGLAGGINTYAYVGSNPLSYVDPEGLQSLLPQPAPSYSPGRLPPGPAGRVPPVRPEWRWVNEWIHQHREGYFNRVCIEYSCPTPTLPVCSAANPSGDPTSWRDGPFFSSPGSPLQNECTCKGRDWGWSPGVANPPFWTRAPRPGI